MKKLLNKIFTDPVNITQDLLKKHNLLFSEKEKWNTGTKRKLNIQTSTEFSCRMIYLWISISLANKIFYHISKINMYLGRFIIYK